MNYTRLTEMLDVTLIRDSRPLVVTSFLHPVRGPVRCPAADLFAAQLRSDGVPVSLGAVDTTPSAPARRPSTRSHGILAATTYLGPDGRATGVAIAAGPEHADLLRRVLSPWSAALRTRRVLITEGPPRCGNAGRAQAAAPARLPASRRVPEADTGRGGCGPWEAARAALDSYLDRGDTVLLVAGAAARRPQLDTGQSRRVLRVDSTEAVAALRVADPGHVSFVVHPCAVTEDAAEILGALRAVYPRLRGQHPDQWCYRESDFRNSARTVGRASDLVLDLTDEGRYSGSADPAGLHVTSLAQLRPELLAPAATVAVIADHGDRDTGSPCTTDVTTALSGLGPLSVVHHRSVTETATGVHERPAAPYPPLPQRELRAPRRRP